MGLISRERTKAYFDWAAVREPYKSKELTLSNGVFVESCGRHRGDGQIQLFVVFTRPKGSQCSRTTLPTFKA